MIDDTEQPRQSTYLNGFLVDEEADANAQGVALHVNVEDEDEEAAPIVGNGVEIKMGCGILGRYPIRSLLSFVVTGMLVGIGLSFWIPTTDEELASKQVALQWIGLIGDMFLRYVSIITFKLSQIVTVPDRRTRTTMRVVVIIVVAAVVAVERVTTVVMSR